MSFGCLTRRAQSYLDSTVTGSHKDFFTRNILVTRCGCGTCGSCTGSGDVAARNRQRSNVPWVLWPNYEDVVQWAHSEGVAAGMGLDGTQNTPALDDALMAAIDDIAEDCGLLYLQVDENGDVALDADGNLAVAEVPRRVKQATIMHAAKIYRRRLSPDGTLGASAFGGAVRVSKYDPQVRDLLKNYLRVGVA